MNQGISVDAGLTRKQQDRRQHFVGSVLWMMVGCLVTAIAPDLAFAGASPFTHRRDGRGVPTCWPSSRRSRRRGDGARCRVAWFNKISWGWAWRASSASASCSGRSRSSRGSAACSASDHVSEGAPDGDPGGSPLCRGDAPRHGNGRHVFALLINGLTTVELFC